jgi:hypothetical protein
MLAQEVQNHFTKLLNQEEDSYGDSFNFDILNFLSLEDVKTKNVYNDFFTSFETLTEIEKWLDLVKSKIVMHEQEDEVNNIIFEYVDLQTNNKKVLCLN